MRKKSGGATRMKYKRLKIGEKIKRKDECKWKKIKGEKWNKVSTVSVGTEVGRFDIYVFRRPTGK
jgi:hypothetical protein